MPEVRESEIDKNYVPQERLINLAGEVHFLCVHRKW